MNKILEFEKDYDLYKNDFPKELIGFNFYSISGEFIGRFSINEKYYPKANYRLIMNLNGKEVEVHCLTSIYLNDDGGYLLINHDGYFRF